jgi:hypothetical protein
MPERKAADQPEPPADSERAQVLGELAAGIRMPFLQELARWLDAGPTDQDLRTLAAKSGDRWAQGVTQLAKLAGFAERVELQAVKPVVSLSDSELLAELSDRLQMPADELRTRLTPRTLPAAEGAPGPGS